MYGANRESFVARATLLVVTFIGQLEHSVWSFVVAPISYSGVDLEMRKPQNHVAS